MPTQLNPEFQIDRGDRICRKRAGCGGRVKKLSRWFPQITQDLGKPDGACAGNQFSSLWPRNSFAFVTSASHLVSWSGVRKLTTR